MSVLDLREAWADLLRRRLSFADSLTVYGDILRVWADTPVQELPLELSADECARVWAKDMPLLAARTPAFDVAAVEELLGPTLEIVAGACPAAAGGLQRFAEAWDRGAVTPDALYPARGRLVRGDASLGLADGVLAFVAVAALRPLLEPHFSVCRQHLHEGAWALGVCPYCGAPPAFGDVLEDGRRRLACSLCGGGWVWSRLRCPFCGTEETKHLTRLEPETTEQGYFVSACNQCHAYLKELDRRVRWNGGPPLLEDWGSVHLDLVTQRAGYWRPTPTLLELSSTPVPPTTH